jgi:molybdenum cofactor biosynthesis enzyme MoaA
MTAKVVIPIRIEDPKLRYIQRSLLADGSVGVDEIEVRELLEDLREEPPITRLEHPEVRYEVTDHCNAACIMCPREEHTHGRQHGIMNQRQYERSIDEVVQIGARKVVLTGFGEPMLDKRLEQKIAYAKSKGLSTYIITNGSVISSKRARDILEAGLDEMRVSFYGMGPETYNKVMRGLDYQETHDGLIQFLALRARLKAHTKVQLSYLTMPENAQHESAFKEYWDDQSQNYMERLLLDGTRDCAELVS